MKKVKTIKQFQFKDQTNQEMVDYLNTKYPIRLKHNEDLINRVYNRYPLLKKSEVGIIIKAVFGSIRELLVLGEILNFNKLLFDFKLHFFEHKKGMVIFPSLKVKVSTPPILKKKL